MSEQKSHPGEGLVGVRALLFIIVITAIVTYIFSLVGPFMQLYLAEVPLDREIEPEVVNGILTVSAILFALSTFSTHALQRNLVLSFMFSTQVLLLLAVGMSYFVDITGLGWVTANTLAWSVSSLFMNLFNWFLYRLLRFYWGEGKFE